MTTTTQKTLPGLQVEVIAKMLTAAKWNVEDDFPRETVLVSNSQWSKT